MDFSEREKVVTTTPVPKRSPSPREDEVTAWFARGIALEEDPNTQPDAIAAYQQVLEIQPAHAAAHINLGTLYYNRQDFALAEKHYRQAIEADPRYALAYFDLGNVLDETGRVQEAHSDLQDRSATRSHLRRRALQSGAGLRKDPRAAQGAQALASLRQARHIRPVVGPCPQPDQAHPASGWPEVGPLPSPLRARQNPKSPSVHERNDAGRSCMVFLGREP